jgi:hypothetical protein
VLLGHDGGRCCCWYMLQGYSAIRLGPAQPQRMPAEDYPLNLCTPVHCRIVVRAFCLQHL